MTPMFSLELSRQVPVFQFGGAVDERLWEVGRVFDIILRGSDLFTRRVNNDIQRNNVKGKLTQFSFLFLFHRKLSG